MTDKQIAEQIEDLKIVTAKFSVSQDSALAFLERAGILQLSPDDEPDRTGNSTPKIKKRAK